MGGGTELTTTMGNLGKVSAFCMFSAFLYVCMKNQIRRNLVRGAPKLTTTQPRDTSPLAPKTKTTTTMQFYTFPLGAGVARLISEC